MDVEELNKKKESLEYQIKQVKQKAVREGIRHLEPEHPFFKLNEELKTCQKRLAELKETNQAQDQFVHSP